MTTNTEIIDLKYPKEPSNFGAHDIEDFVIWATKQGASDITIQNEDQIVCEIHGRIVKVTKKRLSRSELITIISAIYKSDGAVSKLNSGEDVDLPWNIRVDRDTVLRYRVNMTAGTVVGHTGYSITIRTITSRAPLLETLDLPQEIIDNMGPKQGLVLIVGATGSGKSTLLASVLDWRMRQEDANLKILTYEAPIEYVYDDVPKPSSIISQSQIGTHLPSFSSGVRNALRRKPSIILVGEMRDTETIGEGITASMTGHLVYGTLHSNGVSTVVRRMVNMFNPEEKNSRAQDILSSVKLIVGQMLIPTIDGKRVAIREYLVFTEDIVETLLVAGVDNLAYETKKLLEKHGQTFLQDATKKFKEGIISEKEFNKVRETAKVNIEDIKETVKDKEVEIPNEWKDI